MKAEILRQICAASMAVLIVFAGFRVPACRTSDESHHQAALFDGRKMLENIRSSQAVLAQRLAAIDSGTYFMPQR